MYQSRLRCAAGFVRLASGGSGLAVAGAVLLAGLPVQAATLTSADLVNLQPGSATASFSTADAPGTVLTVTESGTGTMTGSDNFGYEGLWLGSDGTGGQYTFAFNAPMQSVAFSFIALTAFSADGLVEKLGSFVSNAPTVASLSGDDGTVTWDAGTLTPLEEDSYAVLSFSVSGVASFNSIRFDHLQPDDLNGFVINRIDFIAAAVPEPAAAMLLALGLAALAAAARRPARPPLS